jgi:uncharacterized protein
VWPEPRWRARSSAYKTGSLVAVTPLILSVLPSRLAVCRLSADAPIPHLPAAGGLWSITRTADELSLVVPEAEAPAGGPIEPGWRAFKVAGPLDFSLTGILAALAEPLAKAGISLFAISTFDTDYVLVREVDLERAKTALRAVGHRVD